MTGSFHQDESYECLQNEAYPEATWINGPQSADVLASTLLPEQPYEPYEPVQGESNPEAFGFNGTSGMDASFYPSQNLQAAGQFEAPAGPSTYPQGFQPPGPMPASVEDIFEDDLQAHGSLPDIPDWNALQGLAASQGFQPEQAPPGPQQPFDGMLQRDFFQAPPQKQAAPQEAPMDAIKRAMDGFQRAEDGLKRSLEEAKAKRAKERSQRTWEKPEDLDAFQSLDFMDVEGDLFFAKP
jgi:hypothetical protein